MRGFIVLILTLLGIGLTVLGLAQLTGGVDGTGVGPLIGGVVLLTIGIVAIRAMATASTDAPTPTRASLGDHSLVDHAADPTTAAPNTAPSPSTSNTSVASTRAIGGSRGILIFAALSVVGVAAGIFSVLSTEYPNVPAHIEAECVDALRQQEGPAASIGTAVTYESVGLTFQEITYETSQGWTWVCTYSTDTGLASTGEIDRG
jgi:hypothetical protein